MKIKYYISIGIILLFLGGGIYTKLNHKTIFGGTIQPISDFTEIQWTAPTTDLTWSEDVKQENFDIKSDGKLQAMKDDLTKSLTQNQKDFVEYQKCPDCIYWKYYNELSKSYPDQLETWWDSEAKSQAQTDTNQRQWEIEKDQQSIMRIDNELRLRQTGFVVVDTGVGTVTPVFGSVNKIIRHIHD